MELTKCTVDTDNIKNLSDTPSISSMELKSLFDKSPKEIKEYINNTLLIEIQKLVKESQEKYLENMDKKILEDNKKKYHIGKIVIETENINPQTYLNFGTWEYWGKGRVPIGVDTEQLEFNTVEKIGGEKEHELTLNEIPDQVLSGYCKNDKKSWSTGCWDDFSNHEYATNTLENSDYKGSQPHNNIQPYITCYMWKRIR